MIRQPRSGPESQHPAGKRCRQTARSVEGNAETEVEAPPCHVIAGFHIEECGVRHRHDMMPSLSVSLNPPACQAVSNEAELRIGTDGWNAVHAVHVSDFCRAAPGTTQRICISMWQHSPAGCPDRGRTYGGSEVIEAPLCHATLQQTPASPQCSRVPTQGCVSYQVKS